MHSTEQSAGIIVGAFDPNIYKIVNYKKFYVGIFARLHFDQILKPTHIHLSFPHSNFQTQKNTLQNLLQSTFFILLNFSEGFYRLGDLRILYTIAYIPLIGE